MSVVSVDREAEAARRQSGGTEVNQILERAGQLLAGWTGSAGFSGYSEGTHRSVLLQAEAVFTAVRERGLAAAEEEGGIREFSLLFGTGSASERELVCLSSVCLERMNLRTLLFFMTDRALLGISYRDEELSDEVLASPAALTGLRKREIPAVVFLDCSVLTAKAPLFLEGAVSRADKILSGSRNFLCCIRGREKENTEGEEGETASYSGILFAAGPGEVLPVAVMDPADPGRALCRGASYILSEQQKGFKRSFLREGFEAADISPQRQRSFRALGKADICTLLPERETAERVKTLIQKEERLLDSGLSRGIYLAVGMLERPVREDGKVHCAPVLLYPAELSVKETAKKADSQDVRNTVSAQLSIRGKAVMNPLAETIMKENFGISVRPFFDASLNGENADVCGFIDALRRTAAGERRWKVLLSSCVLFSGEAEKLLRRPGAEEFSRTARKNLLRGTAAEEENPAVPASLYPLDSAQERAVRAALEKNIILRCPAGTGRTQTEAAITAAFLRGRGSVLFISGEKRSRKDLKERLSAGGLGPFLYSPGDEPTDGVEGKETQNGTYTGAADPSEDPVYEEVAEAEARALSARDGMDGELRSAVNVSRQCGFSVMELLAEAEKTRTEHPEYTEGGEPCFSVDDGFAGRLTRDILAKGECAAEELDAASEEAAEGRKPLNRIGAVEEIDPGTLETSAASYGSVLTECYGFVKNGEGIFDGKEAGRPGLSAKEARDAVLEAQILSVLPERIPDAVLAAEDPERALAPFGELADITEEYETKREGALEFLTDAALERDCRDLDSEWQDIERRHAISRTMAEGAFQRRISDLLTYSLSRDEMTLALSLAASAGYAREEREKILSGLSEEMRSEAEYCGSPEQLREFRDTCLSALDRADEKEGGPALRKKLAGMDPEERAEYREKVFRTSEICGELLERREEFYGVLGIGAIDPGEDIFSADGLLLKSLSESISLLPGVIRWNRARKQAGTFGMDGAAAWLEAGGDPSFLKEKYRFACLCAVLDRVFAEDRRLSAEFGETDPDTLKKAERTQERLCASAASALVRELTGAHSSGSGPADLADESKPVVVTGLSGAHDLPEKRHFSLVILDGADAIPAGECYSFLARSDRAVFVCREGEESTGAERSDVLGAAERAGVAAVSLRFPHTDTPEMNLRLCRVLGGESACGLILPDSAGNAAVPECVRVPGIYDRGSRTNRIEAERIIQLIRQERKNGESVGIIAFTEGQRELLERMMRQVSSGRNRTGESTVRIGVPSDFRGERTDRLYISLTFGPDGEGRLFQGSGPFALPGAAQQLFTACSAAGGALSICTSVSASDLPDSEDEPEGVLALRRLLECFDDEGRCRTDAGSAPRTEGLGEILSKELKERCPDRNFVPGYAGNVPDLLCGSRGILLIPETAAVSPADGRMLRRSLYRRGYRLMDADLRRLRSDREELLREMAEFLGGDGEEIRSTESPAPVLSAHGLYAPEVYRTAELPYTAMDAGAFTALRNRAVIEGKMLAVLRDEAPLAEDVLYRRVVESCGLKRVGNLLRSCMEGIAADMALTMTNEEGTRFCWGADQIPAEYRGIRTAWRGPAHRKIDEVPVQEIANALCCVLSDRGDMQEEQLLGEAAKLMGYYVLRENIRAAFEKGVRYAVNDRRVNLDGNTAALKG